MSLSRRQFLLALGAGLAGGTQLERIAGLDGGSDPVSTLSSRVRPATPTASTAAAAAPTATAVDTAANPVGSDVAPIDATLNPGKGQARDNATLPIEAAGDEARGTRTPSQPAVEPTDTNDDLLDASDIEALANVPAGEPRALGGADLDGWRSVLGDSRHTAAGLATVNADDIATIHAGDHSELVANRHGRGVMAHNTTYLRLVDDNALDMVHEASAYVRTPVTPQQISGLPNGQTVEMALFVWDGKASRRDIGLALQWVINPWSKNFGALRTWTSSGDDSRWSPDPVAWLDPSDEWQFVEMRLHPERREASLAINGLEIPAQCTETTKPDNWAYATAAAVSVELISIWPDDRTTAPTTKLECRDWTWDWSVPA